MCGRDFQTFALCRPKFGQNGGPFADKWHKFFENIYPKTPKTKFLDVFFALLRKFRKNSVG